VISAVQMAAVLFQAKMIIGLNEMIVSYSQCFHVCKIKSSVLCCNGDSFYWNIQTCKKGGDLEICCSVCEGSVVCLFLPNMFQFRNIAQMDN